MPEQKKILVAEDDLVTQQILVMRLEINDFEVLAVADGEEALKKIREEKPDLVILDLMPPGINGFDVCRTVKFDDATKHIPIVILSSLSDQKEREKAVEYGADEYFIKPFDLDLLVTKINNMVSA
jgi:DNA-binding response OmpR family regulator